MDNHRILEDLDISITFEIACIKELAERWRFDDRADDEWFIAQMQMHLRKLNEFKSRLIE